MSSKKDDPRLRDLLQEAPQTFYFSLLGYPDDEGILINKGRPGAKEGPDKIREYLYRMTPPLSLSSNFSLKDHGNIDTSLSLWDRHKEAQKKVSSLLKIPHNLPITLGGGHDYAYPDGAAFLETFQDNPLVINFDAHLDVRPVPPEGPSSGTPFFRLLNEDIPFTFYEIGIQEQCNSQAHLQWCLEKKVRVITHNEILHSNKSLSSLVCQNMGEDLLKPRPTFISIDIDAFSSSYAMGCSQSWPSGLNPDEFLKLFSILVQRLDVKLLGIYEVSPPLDFDGLTSKLAALIIHHYIQASLIKKKGTSL